MRGSVPSQRSRYARRLPAAAVMFGLLAVLPSCASKAGQEQGPAPAAAPKATPKETATAQPKPAPAKPAPAKPTETAKPTPAPATPAPAVAPAPPPPVDSAAVVVQFCKRITDGVKAAIKKDSTVADPQEAVRKIAATVPVATASVAMAKDARCR